MGESCIEGFEDVNRLLVDGWVKINNSEPLGVTGWGQGRPDLDFDAHQGPTNSYIIANFRNTASKGTISNWLLTPEIELRNGTRIVFWTRAADPDANLGPFADRLELRLSTAGASFDVGESELSTGAFDTLLISINPDLTADGYPREWTRYTATLSGMPPDTTGRIAFRYFVTNSGPGGANGDLIGIDTFSIEQPLPPEQPLFSDRFEVTDVVPR